MSRGKIPPDVRVGLVGLRESGKTHFVGVLNKCYWGTDQDTRIEPNNDATVNLFQLARHYLLIEGQPMRPTPEGTNELYSMTFERTPNALKMGGFKYSLEILDVDGEQFLAGDKKIYTSWLVHCNALIFLIDGKQLLKTEKRSPQENLLRRKHIALLERVKDVLMLELRKHHEGKHKIFVAFCVTKYDLFEAEHISPEKLVKERLAPIHEIVEKLSNMDRSWVTVSWYGVSTLGYVWDEQGRYYVDQAGQKIERSSGKRLSQLYFEKDKQLLVDPTILRPEGLEALFEDIRDYAKRNKWELPNLDGFGSDKAQSLDLTGSWGASFAGQTIPQLSTGKDKDDLAKRLGLDDTDISDEE